MKAILAVLAFLAGAPLLEGFDVPLMPGLTEQAEARVAFDKEEGRIIETQLEGSVSAAAAKAYYAEALAGLGWKPAGNGRNRQIYRRGQDRLIIDYAGQGGATRIRLLLEPAETGN